MTCKISISDQQSKKARVQLLIYLRKYTNVLRVALDLIILACYNELKIIMRIYAINFGESNDY